MTDLIGALKIPVATPVAPDGRIDDPLLHYLGQFFQAVANADLGAAWRELSPGDENPVVSFHLEDLDEADAEIDENQFPALFLCRKETDFARAWTVEDSLVVSDIRVWWVLRGDSAEHSHQNGRFWHAFFACLSAAVLREHHPAWIAEGDKDLAAPYVGSNLQRYAGFQPPVLISKGKRERAKLEGLERKENLDHSRVYAATIRVREIETASFPELPTLQGVKGVVHSDRSDPRGPQVITSFDLEGDTPPPGIDPAPTE